MGEAAPLLLPVAATVASAGFVACAIRGRVGLSWAAASAGMAFLLAALLRVGLAPAPPATTVIQLAQPGVAVGVHVAGLLLLALLQVRGRRRVGP